MLEGLFALLIMAAVCLLVYNIVFVADYLKDKFRQEMEKQKKAMLTVEKDSLSGINKSDILRAQAALGIIGLLTAVALNSSELLVVFVVLVILAPKYYVRMKEAAYIKNYRENLPDLLESVTASVRAGMSLINALQYFAEKNDTAAGLEIKNMLSRIEYGLSVSAALSELENRIKIEENELVVTAFQTASESGGNVSEVLETILESIRKKDEIAKEMKALTSQGVLSGFIVGGLPVLMLGAIYVFDRDLIMPLFTTKIGVLMLSVAVCMEAIGAFFISKIVRLKD